MCSLDVMKQLGWYSGLRAGARLTKETATMRGYLQCGIVTLGVWIFTARTSMVLSCTADPKDYNPSLCISSLDSAINDNQSLPSLTLYVADGPPLVNLSSYYTISDFRLPAIFRERKRDQQELPLLVTTTCSRYGLAESFTSRWKRRREVIQSPQPDAESRVCLPVFSKHIAKATDALLHHEGVQVLAILYTESALPVLDRLVPRLQRRSVYIILEKIRTVASINDTWWGILETVNTYLVIAEGLEKSLLTKARSLGGLKPEFTWLFVTHNMTEERWSPVLQPWEKVLLLNVGYPFELCYLQDLQDLEENVELPVWRLNSGSIRLERVGFWNGSSGSLELTSPDLWLVRHFYNRELNIVTTHLPIFHYKEEKNGTVRWRGICVEILDELARALNFSYKLSEPPDGKWGMEETKGNWNGMVGMVLRKEVDFALGKFTINSEREAVIDFAIPFWHESVLMVYRRPEEQQILVYIGPFKWQVWLLFILSVPFMGLVTAAIVAVSPVYQLTVTVHANNRVLYLLKEITWYIYGAALQQGGVWYPASQASKFLVGFWWFFTIALTATYTGNLIAFLTVPRTELPVQTLQDLVDQNSYSYGVVDGSALNSLLKESTMAIYKQMYQKSVRLKENRVKNHAHGLKRAKEENYIYIGEMSGVAPKVFSDCNYTVAKESFFPSSFAFVFPEDSPLIPLMNQRLSKMLEGGLVQRWKRIYYPPDRCSAAQSIEMPKAATLKTTQGAFYVFFFGMTVSLIALCVELIPHFICRKSVKQTQRNGSAHKDSEQPHDIVNGNYQFDMYKNGSVPNGNGVSNGSIFINGNTYF